MKILKKIFSDVYLIVNKFENDKRGKFIKFNQEIIIKTRPIIINFTLPNLSDNLPPIAAEAANPNDWKININPTLDSFMFSNPVKKIGIIIMLPDIAINAKNLVLTATSTA